MIKVKICGVTEVIDANQAADAGADAIGMVCNEGLARSVSCSQAEQIAKSLPAFVCPVLLFVEPVQEVVLQYLSRVPWATLQFHCSVAVDFCESFNRPYFAVCHPSSGQDIDDFCDLHLHSAGVILDAAQGGSGIKFDWSLVPEAGQRKKKLIIAGGLRPDNVAKAIQATNPYGVDASSGVCFPDKLRRKDPTLVSKFIQNAKQINV